MVQTIFGCGMLDETCSFDLVRECLPMSGTLSWLDDDGIGVYGGIASHLSLSRIRGIVVLVISFSISRSFAGHPQAFGGVERASGYDFVSSFFSFFCFLHRFCLFNLLALCSSISRVLV
jgi:hypothetical protein